MSEVIEAQNSLPTIEQPKVSTPAQLLQVALDQGADLDRLEKLMDMQIRWEANEAQKAYVLAMSNFRAEVPTIGKNKPGHNSNYATLDNITSTINPMLARCGLSFAWDTHQTESLITVHCDVTHEQGHTKRVTLSSAPETSGSKNAIQAIGSAVSYLQRYTLLSALGLATGEMDDDGRSAGKPTKSAASETQQYEGPAADILREAASKGKAALNEAWGTLSAKERGELNDLFGQLRKEAN